ncbi:MAG: helix-turn-helix transcriptional regulator [Bacillota bacterium]
MRINRIKLIALMAEKELSTNELVQKSGLSRSTISHIRSGKSCSEQTAEALAKGLSVPVQRICGK